MLSYCQAEEGCGVGKVVPLEGQGIESSSGLSINHSCAKCTEGNEGGGGEGGRGGKGEGCTLRGRIESFHLRRHDASYWQLSLSISLLSQEELRRLRVDGLHQTQTSGCFPQLGTRIPRRVLPCVVNRFRRRDLLYLCCLLNRVVSRRGSSTTQPNQDRIAGLPRESLRFAWTGGFPYCARAICRLCSWALCFRKKFSLRCSSALKRATKATARAGKMESDTRARNSGPKSHG